MTPHRCCSTPLANLLRILRFIVVVKITRACGGRDRALLFRGWSRLCLHAASISAAEGASATAAAVARAARAEALDREAETAAARAEAAAAREEEQRKIDRREMLAAKAKRREEDVSWVALRVKTLVGHFSNHEN